MIDTVVLRSYAHEMEAEIARAVLASEGILSVVQRDDAGGMVPSLQFLRGARLLVHRADAERAEEVLLERAQYPLLEEEQDE